MQNTTRVCVRYESEIYGTALVKAIKEKCSKMLLLLIFFITVLIGYFTIFNFTTDDEESETSRQEAVSQRRAILDDIEEKSHSRATADTTNVEPLHEKASDRVTTKPGRSNEDQKREYKINEEPGVYDTKSFNVADNAQEHDNLKQVSMLAERFVDSLLQEGIRNLKETSPSAKPPPCESFTRTGYQPLCEGQTYGVQRTEPITGTREELPEQTSITKEIKPPLIEARTRPLLERPDDIIQHPDVCPLWERTSDAEVKAAQHPLWEHAGDVENARPHDEVQLRADKPGESRPLGDTRSIWERIEDESKTTEMLAEERGGGDLWSVWQRIDDGSKTQPETKFRASIRRLDVVHEESPIRDSLSDKSDTTIRRRSAKWDSQEAIAAGHDQAANVMDEELDETSPLTGATRVRRRRFRHNHSADDIKAERKTCSDTERGSASVDDEWPDREKFFETLHSARSSISASSLSLLVTSTSQERLSEQSLHSSTDEDAEKRRSIISNKPRLHRTVQQLYAGRIEDRFDSLEEVGMAIEEAGLVHSRIIIGIDYTKSNMETGRKTFGGKCLHTIRHGFPNPYQEVIRILCKTLNSFDEDNMICAYGFGDSRTNDEHVFKLNPASLYCHGFEGVLEAYNLITPNIKLGGPTTFAPMIEEAIKIVESSRAYTILILIADGQLVNEDDTVESIVKASSYPLSIVLVGVGDGPWDKMKEFDDALPERKFDNFQFVNYHQVLKLSSMLPGNQSADSLFALMALMEIPDQYMQIKQLGYLDETTGRYLPPYHFRRID